MFNYDVVLSSAFVSLTNGIKIFAKKINEPRADMKGYYLDFWSFPLSIQYSGYLYSIFIIFDVRSNLAGPARWFSD